MKNSKFEPSCTIYESNVLDQQNKIRLSGFNNLTKTLSFNIYDISYACTATEMKEYIRYTDEEYNAEKLTEILKNVTEIIGANILNVAKVDYEPLGASVALLVSEGGTTVAGITNSETSELRPASLLAHLDKSHLSVHTYPESHPKKGICTFRADIDISTCGTISPLKVLNFLIRNFESDIVMIDYRVRGFTRDTNGKKHFVDSPVRSIQDFIDDSLKTKYKMLDVNLRQANLFHTKMMLREFNLDDYLFLTTRQKLSADKTAEITALIHAEIEEIFNANHA